MVINALRSLACLFCFVQLNCEINLSSRTLYRNVQNMIGVNHGQANPLDMVVG